MSERPDNDGTRDAQLTAAYRAAAQDMPPPALDAAILAAARREVGARPRPAGFSFRAWRGPLSVAAVVVLSVSLVMLMREEAPELVAPPRADDPAAEAKLVAPAEAERNEAPRERRSLSEEHTPKSLGLKPSHSMPQTGLRPPDFREHTGPASNDKAAGRLEADAGAPAASAKRRDAVADSADARAKKNIAASPEPQREAAKTDTFSGFTQPPPPRAVEAPAQKPAPEIGNIMGKALDRDRLEGETRERAQSRDAPAKQMADAVPTEAKPAPPPAAKPPLSPSPEARSAPSSQPPLPQSAPAQLSQAQPTPPPPVAQPAPKPAASPEAKPAFAPPPSVQPMAKSESRENAPVAAADSLSKLERSADLAPDKWLERIEALRKQGKLEEARTSLAEFRKRYPDYRLPDDLRNGIRE
jgi:hypothetical protein